VLAAGGGVDVITDVAVVAIDVVSISDAQTDAAGDHRGGGVRHVHPEMVGREDPAADIARLVSTGALLEEIVEIFAGGDSEVRGALVGQRMMAGGEDSIRPFTARAEEFEIVINKRAWIEEGESRFAGEESSRPGKQPKHR
jgi:hypothetical protein